MVIASLVPHAVAPLAGAWIETKVANSERITRNVAPLAGAWIETSGSDDLLSQSGSHPSRVRGLKHRYDRDFKDCLLVAPLAGAWIETSKGLTPTMEREVAPLAGAWIETSAQLDHYKTGMSHPSRVRGLKPRMGEDRRRYCCRTPRGCVD